MFSQVSAGSPEIITLYYLYADQVNTNFHVRHLLADTPNSGMGEVIDFLSKIHAKNYGSRKLPSTAE